MKHDYAWLMMVMGKLIRQYERGFIVKGEFDREMWLVIALHRNSIQGGSYGVQGF